MCRGAWGGRGGGGGAGPCPSGLPTGCASDPEFSACDPEWEQAGGLVGHAQTQVFGNLG